MSGFNFREPVGSHPPVILNIKQPNPLPALGGHNNNNNPKNNNVQEVPGGGTDVPDLIIDRLKQRTYSRGRFLGKGGFARCYEVKDTRTGEVFACKVVNKQLLLKTHQRDKMVQEITIHRSLKHEFIVGFHTYFEDDANVYILLELCSKKSLMEMQKRRLKITEGEARYFLRQIMLAVDYLHGRKMIHRDLKLGNIFVSETINLKIGDFGLATFENYDGERKKTLCGTPNYIAPEVLSKKGHSFEVDIWSAGCILYTLLVGRPPFETSTLKDTYAKIRRCEFTIPTGSISPAAKHLIIRMLQLDPSVRPTASQVLQSDFLNKFAFPKSLPPSVLTLAPRFNDQKMQKRPLNEHNPKSPLTTGSTADPKAAEPVRDLKIISAGHMKDLLKQLKMLMAKFPKERGMISDDTLDDPNSAPMLWISKWVDYSDKYGFGYQLSDDSIGVSFNDMTRMVLLNDGINMHYVDKSGIEMFHTLGKYPFELAKKVKLLNYFKQYMTENLLKAGASCQPPETAAMARLPSMWTWFRSSRAVVMVLSNGTLQINNFKDHTKTILCPLMGAISTLEHQRPMKTYKFSSIERYGCSKDLKERLQYAVDKLEVLLGHQKTAKQDDQANK